MFYSWRALFFVGILKMYVVLRSRLTLCDTFAYHSFLLSEYKYKLVWKGKPLSATKGFYSDETTADSVRLSEVGDVPERNTVGQRRKETYYELFLSWWLLWGFSSIFWFPVLCKYEPWVEGEGDVMVTWRNVACLVVSLRWEKKCSAGEMVLVSLVATRLSWITSKREDYRWRWSVNHFVCVCVCGCILQWSIQFCELRNCSR